MLEQNSEAKLGKVDATIESELAEKYEVKGYPTLKFFRKGNPVEYNGGRQSEDIVNWVIKKSGPAVKEIATVEEAKALIDSQNVVFIGFFKDQTSDNAKIYLDIGNAVDDYVFGISSNDDVFSEYGAEDGKVILFKKVNSGFLLGIIKKKFKSLKLTNLICTFSVR